MNEMLLQAHQGVLRVFPVWPRDRAASFGRLRTPGAFLVSSELRNGEVVRVVVESELGRKCRMVNPWPGRRVTLRRPGQADTVLSGGRIEWKTYVGETAVLEGLPAENGVPTRN